MVADPYDCGYAIVRNAAALQRAMTIGASYLPTAPAGALDPADAVPELSRRARDFATWALIRTLGRQGIAALIEQHLSSGPPPGGTTGGGTGCSGAQRRRLE